LDVRQVLRLMLRTQPRSGGVGKLGEMHSFTRQARLPATRKKSVAPTHCLLPHRAVEALLRKATPANQAWLASAKAHKHPISKPRYRPAICA
jgi:hypothetical protein